METAMKMNKAQMQFEQRFSFLIIFDLTYGWPLSEAMSVDSIVSLIPDKD